MITTAPVRTARRALMLVALLGMLIVGVIGMHHFTVMPSTGPASGTASSEVLSSTAEQLAVVQPPDVASVHGWTSEHGVEGRLAGPRPHDDHGASLLHLCFAVLTTVAVLATLVQAGQERPRTARVEFHAFGCSETAPRSPPPTAPARLALLCVLRT